MSRVAKYSIKVGALLGEEGVAKRYEALVMHDENRTLACELLHVPMAAYSGMDDDFGHRLRDSSKIVAHHPHPYIPNVYGISEDFDIGGVAVVRAQSEGLPLSELAFLQPVPERAALAVVEAVSDVLTHLGRLLHPTTRVNYNLTMRGLSMDTVRLAADGSLDVVGLETLGGDWITRQAVTIDAQGPLRVSLAPEQFQNFETSETAVFHLGLLLLELVTPREWLKNRRFGYRPTMDENAWHQAVDETLEQVNVRLDNELTRRLLRAMLDFDPERRPTAPELLDAAVDLGASRDELAQLASRHESRFIGPSRHDDSLTGEVFSLELFGASLRVRPARLRSPSKPRVLDDQAVPDPSRISHSDGSQLAGTPALLRVREDEYPTGGETDRDDGKATSPSPRAVTATEDTRTTGGTSERASPEGPPELDNSTSERLSSTSDATLFSAPTVPAQVATRVVQLSHRPISTHHQPRRALGGADTAQPDAGSGVAPISSAPPNTSSEMPLAVVILGVALIVAVVVVIVLAAVVAVLSMQSVA